MVVDDGSTDNTENVPGAYQKGICIIVQSNYAKSIATNRGIGVDHGTWIGILNSDDEWMQGYLKLQMKRADMELAFVAHITNSSEILRCSSY